MRVRHRKSPADAFGGFTGQGNETKRDTLLSVKSITLPASVVKSDIMQGGLDENLS